MIIYIADSIPFVCFLWSLALTLFYRNLYLEFYDNDKTFELIAPPLILCLVIAALLILPVGQCIKKCNIEIALSIVPYKEAVETFVTDYDKENPVTKKQGELRLLDIKIKKYAADMDDKVKEIVEKQKEAIKNASVFDAVRNYSNVR